MEIIKPHVYITRKFDPQEVISFIANTARICYQSEGKSPDEHLIKSVVGKGHTSVIEHVSFTFDMIVDRGVTHELVRHRIASYTQESTRYVKYNNDNMAFILPIEIAGDIYLYRSWVNACRSSEEAYTYMMNTAGTTAQNARSVLNNSIKSQIRITMNARSLINFFNLRCAKSAHPHMKEVAIPLLLYMQEKLPVIFGDIKYDEDFYNMHLSDDRWRSYISEGFPNGTADLIVK